MSLSLRTPPLPFLSPIRKSQFQSQSRALQFPCFSTPRNKNNNNISRKRDDSPEAAELAAEAMQKIKSQVEERENALIKSKQMLFTELCNSLNLSPEEGRSVWVKMNPDEKMGLAKGFVAEWGLRFHPLSPTSVRDLLDEYVIQDSQHQGRYTNSSDKNPNLGLFDSDSDSSEFFPGLRKFFMGLSQDK